MKKRKRVGLVWDRYGPLHLDRLESGAAALGGSADCTGIELTGASDTYEWDQAVREGCKKDTLFLNLDLASLRDRDIFIALIRYTVRNKLTHVVMSHYQRAGIFWTAVALRIIGIKTYCTMVSKFDDRPRNIWREIVKVGVLAPYNGALAASPRSEQYLRFLGFFKRPVKVGHNTLSVDRLRRLRPIKRPRWEDRYFIVVARLIEKKNILSTVDAYALYVAGCQSPRRLVIVGSGPKLNDIERRVATSGVSHLVDFLGFLQEVDVTRAIDGALALVLISSEEQYGNVIAEAVALEVPVIISTACGAADELVRSWVNGFVVEFNNVEGTSKAMRLLSESYDLWESFSVASKRFHPMIDSARFGAALVQLVAASPELPEETGDEHSQQQQVT